MSFPEDSAQTDNENLITKEPVLSSNPNKNCIFPAAATTVVAVAAAIAYVGVYRRS